MIDRSTRIAASAAPFLMAQLLFAQPLEAKEAPASPPPASTASAAKTPEAKTPEAKTPEAKAPETKAPSPGQSAARVRQKTCGAEWRGLTDTQKAAQGPKWPQFWSSCNKRLKGGDKA